MSRGFSNESNKKMSSMVGHDKKKGKILILDYLDVNTQ